MREAGNAHATMEQASPSSSWKFKAMLLCACFGPSRDHENPRHDTPRSVGRLAGTDERSSGDASWYQSARLPPALKLGTKLAARNCDSSSPSPVHASGATTDGAAACGASGPFEPGSVASAALWATGGATSQTSHSQPTYAVADLAPQESGRPRTDALPRRAQRADYEASDLVQDVNVLCAAQQMHSTACFNHQQPSLGFTRGQVTSTSGHVPTSAIQQDPAMGAHLGGLAHSLRRYPSGPLPHLRGHRPGTSVPQVYHDQRRGAGPCSPAAAAACRPVSAYVGTAHELPARRQAGTAAIQPGAAAPALAMGAAAAAPAAVGLPPGMPPLQVPLPRPRIRGPSPLCSPYSDEPRGGRTLSSAPGVDHLLGMLGAQSAAWAPCAELHSSLPSSGSPVLGSAIARSAFGGGNHHLTYGGASSQGSLMPLESSYLCDVTVPATGMVCVHAAEEMGMRAAPLDPYAVGTQLSALVRLGQGAHGVVYRGLWHGCPAAVKFMVSEGPQRLCSQLTEVMLCKTLSHPHVVQTYSCSVWQITPASLAACDSVLSSEPRPPTSTMTNTTTTGADVASPQAARFCSAAQQQQPAGGPLFDPHPHHHAAAAAAAAAVVAHLPSSSAGGGPPWNLPGPCSPCSTHWQTPEGGMPRHMLTTGPSWATPAGAGVAGAGAGPVCTAAVKSPPPQLLTTASSFPRSSTCPPAASSMVRNASTALLLCEEAAEEGEDSVDATAATAATTTAPAPTGAGDATGASYRLQAAAITGVVPIVLSVPDPPKQQQQQQQPVDWLIRRSTTSIAAGDAVGGGGGGCPRAAAPRALSTGTGAAGCIAGAAPPVLSAFSAALVRPAAASGEPALAAAAAAPSPAQEEAQEGLPRQPPPHPPQDPICQQQQQQLPPQQNRRRLQQFYHSIFASPAAQPQPQLQPQPLQPQPLQPQPLQPQPLQPQPLQPQPLQPQPLQPQPAMAPPIVSPFSTIHPLQSSSSWGLLHMPGGAPELVPVHTAVAVAVPVPTSLPMAATPTMLPGNARAMSIGQLSIGLGSGTGFLHPGPASYLSGTRLFQEPLGSGALPFCNHVSSVGQGGAAAGRCPLSGAPSWHRMPTRAFSSALRTGDEDGDAAAAEEGARSVAQVVRVLGAKESQVLVQIVMEECDRGSLQQLLARVQRAAEAAAAAADAPAGSSGGGGGGGGGIRTQHGAVYAPFQFGGKWTSQQALKAVLLTAKEVALGMAFLHLHNIMHGDLKPGNVLLRSSRSDLRGFVAKISDFGVSKVLHPAPGACAHPHQQGCDPRVGRSMDGSGASSRAVHTGMQGTLTYLAPEAIDGFSDKPSDVYSFGILLWQLVTGGKPYDGMRPAQIMAAMSAGEECPMAWPAACHPCLMTLGRACTAYDPKQRPTFAQVVKVLQQLDASVRLPAPTQGDPNAGSRAVNGAPSARVSACR